ncbi:MAG: aldo/keto reductase, partial [Chloroflexota bacterium]|nr:aldo/keto reductase [Chloroflexota bacterium]
METRRLGQTDMDVSWLGFGAARIATDTGSPAKAEALLNALLDSGVNYIDTAECYGESEETLGKYLSHRRDEYWLTTKCGHVAGDVTAPEWTAEAVSQSIDQSLRRMHTDYLDLVHIHTCKADVLRQGDVLRALQDAQRAGKTRYIGFSGDNEVALEAIGMGEFATLLTSFNVVDQKGLDEVLPAAEAVGMGIIAKRPIANAAFNRPASPYDYADAYWERAQYFTLPEGAPEDGATLALRFCHSFDYIDTAIVGIDSI